MQAEYVLELAGRPMGTVRVQRQGLYYCVRCRCALDGKEMYRLTALCGSSRLDLGTLVPMGDGFGADTRFPVSRVGDGPLCFRLEPKNSAPKRAVPIDPAQPFPYLHLLRYAVLHQQDGTAWAEIPEDKI